MKIMRDLRSILILFGLLTGASCKTSFQKKEKLRTDTLDYSPGTFLISKLLMLPSLATIGLKFLLLLPIFLAKLGLLGIMNFVATNVNLLISAVMAVRNYFSGEGKPFWSDIHRHIGIDYWRPHHQAPPITKFEYVDSHGDTHEITNYSAVKKQEFGLEESKNLNVQNIPEINSKDEDSLLDDSWKYKCVWVKDNGNKKLYKRHHTTVNEKSDKPKYFQWRLYRI